MRKYLARYLGLLILGFLFTRLASAQDPYLRAMEPCGDTRASETSGGVEFVFSVSGWTGGCVDGKRDGRGELTWTLEHKPIKTIRQMEGQFVRGAQVGLWCTTKYQTYMNGELGVRRDARDFTGCSVMGATGSGTYRKLGDGRWQLYAVGLPADPPTYVAAGVLEAESARLLAAATSGATVLKSELVVQSQVLDDLVRGSRIVLAPIAGPIALKGKRVAVVLSSNMIAELERFRRERAALIAGTSGFTGEAAAIRAQFITASNPDRLLVDVAKVLRRHALEVQSFDDSLAELGKAGFDYALVVDWKYTTRLDLLGKYDAFPAGTYDQLSAGAIAPLEGESLSGFLISPDLKAVRQYASSATNHPKHVQVGTDISTRGDSGYLFALKAYFELAWGRSPDDLGFIVSKLQQGIQQ